MAARSRRGTVLSPRRPHSSAKSSLA
jgi:hypothetical protein